MEYKPNDLFVGVIDFFGILVPGAVLMLLHGQYLISLLGVCEVPQDKVFVWIGFFIGSLLLGHFLTGMSVLLLNRAHGMSFGDVDRYYREVEQQISVPVARNRKAAYHRAYSFIRLNSTAGIAEIDRQVAEYKLFRSLTIAFLIDLGFAIAALDVRHIIFSTLIALLSWYRFASLVCWTQQVTFEYYVLLTGANRN